MNKDYFLGIEIHDESLWEPTRVFKVIETMEKRGYNALILHQNDLLDAATQIGHGANFGLYDLRWKKVINRLAWFQQLTRKLDKFGAKLFLEVKEPSFHDYVLTLYPELIDSEGSVDPTHPKWFEVCRKKTEAVLESVPGLGGLIVNISSPESRVSLPDYLMDKGKQIDIDAWFKNMIEAFYEPLKKTGQQLYIRDFAYTKDLQVKCLNAIDRFNGEVGASIKITPHDYFPEYPNNRVAHDVSAPKLIEFEAFGEHTGWGLVPNCRVAELAERMDFVRDVGAKGLFVRISWEAMTGPHALDCLSDVNVYALSVLAKGKEDPHKIVCDWLAERHGLDADSKIASDVADIMLASWHVIAAAYWHGNVFPRHSRLPHNWREGWHSMKTDGMGSREKEAYPHKGDDYKLTDEQKEKLFAEKDNAVKIADETAAKAQELAKDLPADLAKQLTDSFSMLPYYARQFELATKGTCYALEGTPENNAELDRIRDAMFALADEVGTVIRKREDAPHYLFVMFDPDHIRLFAESLDDRIAEDRLSA